MPVFSSLAYSNTDLGRPASSISTGTFTVGAPGAIMNVLDNDTVFDDESTGGGQTLDSSQQVLDSAFDGAYAAGQVVRSVFRYTLTNNTTGETGTAYLIRIYTGTNPSSPGGQDGPYYNAFDIPVSVGDSITLSSGNYIGQVDYSDLVVCFTAGTSILTKKGEQPIETLRVGDMIATRDNGLQPLRWIGSKTVAATGKTSPICIAEGALENSQPLLVSPNHRMLINVASNDLLFAQREVLVSAKHLIGTPGIFEKSGGSVTYIHLLFDRHEIVFANGTPSESFFPGEPALDALENEARDEVLSLFPELKNRQTSKFAATARLCLSRGEAMLLNQ